MTELSTSLQWMGHGVSELSDNERGQSNSYRKGFSSKLKENTRLIMLLRNMYNIQVCKDWILAIIDRPACCDKPISSDG